MVLCDGHIHDSVKTLRQYDKRSRYATIAFSYYWPPHLVRLTVASWEVPARIVSQGPAYEATS